MSSSIGLYYPYIHFRDENWVKISALYWDEIHRVVPEDDTPEDSPLVQRLRERGGIVEGGFIKPIDPSEGGSRSASYVVGQTFVNFVKRHKHRLQERYSVDRMERWPEVPAQWLDRQGQKDKVAHLFHGKMHPSVRKELLDAKLALDEPRQLSLGMHPRLAFIFMSSIAQHLATKEGFQPVTDDPLAHLVVKGCTPDRLAEVLLPRPAQPEKPSGPEETELLLVTIAIQAWAPRELAHLDAADILDIREQNKTQLTDYRHWIHTLVTSWDWIEGITDEDTLRKRLQERYTREMEPVIKSLDSQMRKQKWVSTAGALTLTVAVPGALSLVGGWFGIVPDPSWGTTAAVSLGLHKVVADKEKAERELSSKEAAFLVKLKSYRRPLLRAVQKQAGRLRARPAA